jgi:hypothetical protein
MKWGLAIWFVMPGHVPGIHVLKARKQERRGWPGRSPAMTESVRAAEESINHGLCRGGAFVSYPVENVFQIGERLVVPNEFHAVIYEPSRAIRSRASA